MKINKTYQKIALFLKISIVTFIVSLISVVVMKNIYSLMVFGFFTVLTMSLMLSLLLKRHMVHGKKKYSYQLLFNQIMWSVHKKIKRIQIPFIINIKKITTLTFFIGLTESLTYLFIPTIHSIIMVFTLISLLYLVSLIMFYTVFLTYKVATNEINLSFMVCDVYTLRKEI